MLETSERGITSDDKVDKMLMLVQGLLSGMKEERDSRRNTVLDKGRMVDHILSYREGSNISHFLLAFEAELKDIGVNKSEYRHILISKLPSKTKESVLDLMGSGACTYEKLKARLLEKVGLSQREVEIKLFVDLEDETKNMDRVERYRHVKMLVDRFAMNAKDKDQLALFLMKAIFRLVLPLTEQGLIDSKQSIQICKRWQQN